MSDAERLAALLNERPDLTVAEARHELGLPVAEPRRTNEPASHARVRAWVYRRIERDYRRAVSRPGAYGVRVPPGA